MPDQAVITTASEVAEFLERHRACSKARPWAGRCATLRKPGTDALCPIGSSGGARKPGSKKKTCSHCVSGPAGVCARRFT